MEFTYEGYQRLLELLIEHGYQIVGYKNWQEADRCVILRHDIDYDMGKAVKLAEIEGDGGVTSTYFVLLTSDFYNAFSKEGCDALKRIKSCGHAVGLHFDEGRYPEVTGDVEAIKRKIIEEAEILGRVAGGRIDIVSMHRPSRFVLEADMDIPGMVNSYGQTYFKEFKYLSDSRRRWREPVEEIIRSEEYGRLHILTHPFWYNRIEEDIHGAISAFINGGNSWRYQTMEKNITDLASAMPREEIMQGETGI